MKKLVSAVLLVSFALSLSACNTMAGIGKDVELDRVIVDKNARIGAGARLVNARGLDHVDGDGYYIRSGIIIVPKNGIDRPETLIGPPHPAAIGTPANDGNICTRSSAVFCTKPSSNAIEGSTERASPRCNPPRPNAMRPSGVVRR